MGLVELMIDKYMVELNRISQRVDYEYNLLSELKEFVETEITPLARELGSKRNPYKSEDPRYNWWEKENKFWRTKENNYFAFSKQST